MESDPVRLSELYIQTWYQDKNLANIFAKQLVETYSAGIGLEHLAIHYDRCFYNLNFNECSLPAGKLSIAVLCFPHYIEFKPEEVVKGEKFSGSEEALIYMSKLLASLQHRVVIYANVSNKLVESLKPHNPRYLPLRYFDNGEDSEGQFDIVICWRMYEFSRAHTRGKRVYLWLQDLPPNSLDTTGLNGVFYLSQYQRSLFERVMNKPVAYTVAGNGLYLEYYTEEIRKQTTRIKHSCFYGSNYGKGLKVLLEIWDKVLQHYPQATLHICFGRTNWNTISQQELDYIISLIEKHPSVKEYGRLANSEVAKVMMQCSILAYPVTHPSATFEITAVQAQAAGCIPAVLWNYCLPEVVHPAALHCDKIEDYLDILLSAFDAQEKIDRNLFINWGLQFSWERVCEKWLELIQVD